MLVKMLDMKFFVFKRRRRIVPDVAYDILSQRGRIADSKKREGTTRATATKMFECSLS